MPSTSQEIHRVHSQKDGEVELGLFFRGGKPKIQLAASLDHIFQNLVDGVLVLAGPTRHFSSHFSTKPVQKGCRAQLASMAGQTGKQPF